MFLSENSVPFEGLYYSRLLLKRINYFACMDAPYIQRSNTWKQPNQINHMMLNVVKPRKELITHRLSDLSFVQN